MSSADTAQMTGVEKTETQINSGQNESKPLVDLSNPNDVGNTFKNSDTQNQSVVSSNGQMMFDHDIYGGKGGGEEHHDHHCGGGDHHQPENGGASTGDGTTASTTGSDSTAGGTTASTTGSDSGAATGTTGSDANGTGANSVQSQEIGLIKDELQVVSQELDLLGQELKALFGLGDQSTTNSNGGGTTTPTDGSTPVATNPGDGSAPVTTQPVEGGPVVVNPIIGRPQPIGGGPVGVDPIIGKPITPQPVDSTPIITQPVDTTPVTTKPIDGAPVSPTTSPSDSSSASSTPVDSAPANNTPVDSTTGSGQPNDSSTAGGAGATQNGEYMMYSNGKMNWGGDFSFAATPDYHDTTGNAPDGGQDIKVTLTGQYGGFQPYSSVPGDFDNTSYKDITFQLKSDSNATFDMDAKNSYDQDAGPAVDLSKYAQSTPEAGQWTTYDVPIADIGVANEKDMYKFAIQDQSDPSGSSFYLDNIGFTK